MEYSQIQDKFCNYEGYIVSSEDYTISSVLIPLVEINNKLHIVFQVRSARLKSQPCEISFPGGKIDKEDFSPMHAALRETKEEFGLSQKNIDIISELDLFVSPFGVIIHCFLGKISSLEDIIINPDEVDSYFSVPLEYFLQTEPESYTNSLKVDFDGEFPFDLVPSGKKYNFRTPKYKTYFYRYENRIIWGMTAVILYNFISKLKEL